MAGLYWLVELQWALGLRLVELRWVLGLWLVELQ